MKNVLPIFIALFLHLSFTSPIAAQVSTPSPTEPTEIDTIILFDAVTFEETVKVVVPMAENMAGETYEIDTIITFNADTYEETVEIVKTKVVASTPFEASEKITLTEAEIGIYQIDTIITFHADTYEETIQVVKTKIKKKE